MKTVALCLAPLCLVLSLAGCGKNIDTPEAVKLGVVKDIAKKVDVQNMEVNVDSVSFRGKEATANISFRPKGGDPKQSITMKYELERKGDEWAVKGRNMQRHEEKDPSAAPPPPGDTTGGLPPGHMPITGGATGQLPPGHMPIPPAPTPGK